MTKTKNNVWLKLYDDQEQKGLVEFTVDTYLYLSIIPRIGETVFWDKLEYIVTHVKHPLRKGVCEHIQVVGLEKQLATTIGWANAGVKP